ncbi:MAG: bacteriohemerythrin [Proteobacteria bacterium]|nr:bacteriohemerythrin [Pseudomonadota bacterium]MBU1716240.1 bacteriohemerythrin [Pseudomonadota bacterium]
MGLFVWKDDYSVNIKEIDTQHKKLIDMINELHEAMSERRGKDVLNDILAKLANYTVSHFSTEERIMRTNDYPAYQEHREKHEKMTAKVLALQNEVKTGKGTITLEVMNFLKNWLDKHILGTDKQYAPFLKSKGVS